MTPDPDQQAPPPPQPEERASHLKRLRTRGSIVAWSVVGAALCAAGLLALTGMASSPWLFLLYPLLIGGVLISLSLLALQLLHRL
jgi:hypothetical protein